MFLPHDALLGRKHRRMCVPVSHVQLPSSLLVNKSVILHFNTSITYSISSLFGGEWPSSCALLLLDGKRSNGDMTCVHIRRIYILLRHAEGNGINTFLALVIGFKWPQKYNWRICRRLYHGLSIACRYN
jgi:hypothetical protein